VTALEIRTFEFADRGEVIDLWTRCDLTRPWNDPSTDIDRKCAIDRDGFLVGLVDGAVVATVMAGYDGHRGWINYLGVHPDHRGMRHGQSMMAAAEQLLAARGCPKVNLQIRTSNSEALHFYESIGYTHDDVVSMGRRLVDDRSDDDASR
jgi:ribosomal protein S18 acetylase RimI-like enzyme